MTSLMLCDDHPLILRGLADLIAADTDIDIVATCGGGQQAIDAIREHMPDVAVLDISMPERDGIDVLKEVAREQWPVRVVFLTGCITDEQVIQAIAAGADGVVVKGGPDATLG